MTTSEVGAVRALARAAIARIRETNSDLRDLYGTAYYDEQKDEFFTSLDGFAKAQEAVARLPHFACRYGVAEARRITLQLVYNLLERLSDPTFDDHAFQGLWNDFIDELELPQWVYRGVANVRWITAETGTFVVGEDVTIRGRSFSELSDLGFSKWVLQGLRDDWSGYGASSYVILTESRVDKSPDNFVLGSLGVEWVNAQRALQAMRLLAPGDVTMGSMWIVRAAKFRETGGRTQVGATVQTMGSNYHLTESIAAQAANMYSDLQHLESQGYGGAPGNLNLALSSFMGTYDRWPSRPDSKVLDAITALEAVIGSGTEIAFKLAFRTAGILAGSDAERLEIFETMKRYYDLRSKLVHGASLKERHQILLNDSDRLRHLVRQMLGAFVHLAVVPQEAYGTQFFREVLDSALQSATEREALRAALDLT